MKLQKDEWKCETWITLYLPHVCSDLQWKIVFPKWNEAMMGRAIDARWNVIPTSHKRVADAITAETGAGDVTAAFPNTHFVTPSFESMFFDIYCSCTKHTHHISSFHFIPFYFTQHNNTVHVVFFCTEAFQELVTDTGCSLNRCQWKVRKVFIFFFLFFPLKNINFVRGPLKSLSVCYLLFVSLCLYVKKTSVLLSR